jgi:hypothetical protein
MKNIKKVLAVMFTLLFIMACSFSSSGSQNQPNTETESGENSVQASQEPQQLVETPTVAATVDENSNSLIRFLYRTRLKILLVLYPNGFRKRL